MKWFGTAKREPGWLAIALSEGELRFVHGHHAPAGKSAIARYGSASFEARAGAVEKRIKDLLDYHVDDATLDVLDIPPESGPAGRTHSMYAVAARNEVIKERVKTF